MDLSTVVDPLVIFSLYSYAAREGWTPYRKKTKAPSSGGMGIVQEIRSGMDL
jgi:hypothetical protein